MHVIKLNGYNATTENGEKLELGTFDSYGEEQLQIVEAPDWVNLRVIATFNPPNKKPVQVVVDSVTGVIKVPKEATANLYGVGTIVFVGLADGVQRISADCEYIVRKHSNASGTEPAEPTPDLLQQVLTLSKDAQTPLSELPIWKQRLLLSTERSNKMAIKSKARHDLTLRSIKREIAAGRDVAFWLDKAYTHLDNGLLDEADISEVEALAQEYYDALDAASDVTSENAETNEQIKNDA